MIVASVLDNIYHSRPNDEIKSSLNILVVQRFSGFNGSNDFKFPRDFGGMNFGIYVFSQVVSVMDPNNLKTCVERYGGNYKVKDFTCWHQLLCMMFGQLANRESLSDLVLCLQTQKSKWCHLGIGTSI